MGCVVILIARVGNGSRAPKVAISAASPSSSKLQADISAVIRVERLVTYTHSPDKSSLCVLKKYSKNEKYMIVGEPFFSDLMGNGLDVI